MELKHKIQGLEKNLKHREIDIEELRADVARQCNRYNEFWKAHGDLLMEAHTLRSQVPIRSFGGRAEGTSGQSGGVSSQFEGSSNQTGDTIG